MKLIWHGKIEGGSVKIHTAEKADFMIHLKKMEGQPVELWVEKERDKHSDAQRRYMHGVVVKVIARELGYTHDEMWDLIKYKFLPKQHDVIDKATGEVIETVTVPGSSKLLTHDEYLELIDSVIRWAATDLHIVIPDSERVQA